MKQRKNRRCSEWESSSGRLRMEEGLPKASFGWLLKPSKSNDRGQRGIFGRRRKRRRATMSRRDSCRILGGITEDFMDLGIALEARKIISGSVEDGTMVERVLQSFQKSGLLHPAGIAASLSKSWQQWDFPMGWAPLQHMIIEGFSKSGSKAAWTLAEDIALRWIRTNFAAFKTSGQMYEKYDVVGCGKIGTDGVYKPKTGFGWSNGVVLSLLEEFGWPSDREIACQ